MAIHCSLRQRQNPSGSLPTTLIGLTLLSVLDFGIIVMAVPPSKAAASTSNDNLFASGLRQQNLKFGQTNRPLQQQLQQQQQPQQQQASVARRRDNDWLFGTPLKRQTVLTKTEATGKRNDFPIPPGMATGGPLFAGPGGGGGLMSGGPALSPNNFPVSPLGPFGGPQGNPNVFDPNMLVPMGGQQMHGPGQFPIMGPNLAPNIPPGMGPNMGASNFLINPGQLDGGPGNMLADGGPGSFPFGGLNMGGGPVGSLFPGQGVPRVPFGGEPFNPNMNAGGPFGGPLNGPNMGNPFGGAIGNPFMGGPPPNIQMGPMGPLPGSLDPMMGMMFPPGGPGMQAPAPGMGIPQQGGFGGVPMGAPGSMIGCRSPNGDNPFPIPPGQSIPTDSGQILQCVLTGNSYTLMPIGCQTTEGQAKMPGERWEERVNAQAFYYGWEKQCRPSFAGNFVATTGCYMKYGEMAGTISPGCFKLYPGNLFVSCVGMEDGGAKTLTWNYVPPVNERPC